MAHKTLKNAQHRVLREKSGPTTHTHTDTHSERISASVEYKCVVSNNIGKIGQYVVISNVSLVGPEINF